MPDTQELVKIAAIRRAAQNGDMRVRREEACAKLVEVAAALGVSPPALSIWERGQGCPTAVHALRWDALLREIEAGQSSPKGRTAWS